MNARTQPPPPPEVKRWSRHIGVEAALKMIETYGGTRLYIPERAEGSALADAIGVEATHVLSRLYGREAIRVPLARQWRVLLYRYRNLSYRDIARQCGCTESQVWRILKEHERTAAQLALF